MKSNVWIKVLSVFTLFYFFYLHYLFVLATQTFGVSQFIFNCTVVIEYNFIIQYLFFKLLFLHLFTFYEFYEVHFSFSNTETCSV